MTGRTERAREDRQSKQQQDFRRVLRDVARDDFVASPKLSESRPLAPELREAIKHVLAE